jgi:hypothetical protein
VDVQGICHTEKPAHSGDTPGIGRYMAVGSKMLKEPDAIISPHLIRVFQSMKTNKTPDPLNTDLFGSETVSIQPHKPGNLIQKRAFAYGSYPPERTGSAHKRNPCLGGPACIASVGCSFLR